MDRTPRQGFPQAFRRAGRLAVAVVCAGAIALAGCGPKVNLLDQNRALDASSLVQGGIAVLGATTAMGTWDERVKRRETLTRRFESALRDERTDLRVVPCVEIRSALGDRYDDVMDGWDRSGALNEESLADLDSLVGARLRHVALARVEDSSVSKDESTDYTNPDKPTTIMKTTRTVRVAFQVYDLESRQSVWSATLEASDDKSESFEEDTDDFVTNLVEGLLGLDQGPEYPEAPKSADILPSIFSRFAKELPALK